MLDVEPLYQQCKIFLSYVGICLITAEHFREVVHISCVLVLCMARTVNIDRPKRVSCPLHAPSRHLGFSLSRAARTCAERGTLS